MCIIIINIISILSIIFVIIITYPHCLVRFERITDLISERSKEKKKPDNN